jgi:hypothetical protein
MECISKVPESKVSSMRVTSWWFAAGAVTASSQGKVIGYRHDFYAFSLSRRPNLLSSGLHLRKGVSYR